MAEFNSKIEEQKMKSLGIQRRDSGKDLFGHTVIDKHLVNTKVPPTSKPIISQADLDNTLSDLNFEMLVFLKLNGVCCREWGYQPSKTSGNSRK